MNGILFVSTVLCAVVAYASALDLKSVDEAVSFKDADKNTNGYVCKKEIGDFLKEKAGHELKDEDLERIIRVVDFNRNGKLEDEEFKIIVKHHNKFVELDTKKDGKLTFEEIKPYFTGLGASEKEIKEFIEEVDVDESKHIEFDEFLFLAVIIDDFKKNDKDGNKEISTDELSTFVRSTGAKVSGQDVERLKLAADDNNNRKIDLDEFAKVFLILDAFRAHDANNSGHVDKEELKKFLAQEKVEISEEDLVRLLKVADEDSNDLVDVDEFGFIFAGVKAMKKHDKDSSKHLDEAELKEYLKEVEIEIAENDLKELITALDEDGDGKIDYDEFVELIHAVKHYRFFDADNDKKINTVELTKFLDLTHVKVSGKDIVRLEIAADDDHNKSIDIDEFSKIYLIVTNFKYFDKNRSLHLNSKELGEFLKSIKLTVADAELTRLFKIVDEDANNLIDVDEFGFIYVSAVLFRANGKENKMVEKEKVKKLTNLDDDGITKVFTAVKATKPDSLDLPEFVEVIQSYKIFVSIDLNGDKTVTKEGITKGFVKLGHGWDPKKIKDQFTVADQNTDNKLSFVGFAKFFHPEK